MRIPWSNVAATTASTVDLRDALWPNARASAAGNIRRNRSFMMRTSSAASARVLAGRLPYHDRSTMLSNRNEQLSLTASAHAGTQRSAMPWHVHCNSASRSRAAWSVGATPTRRCAARVRAQPTRSVASARSWRVGACTPTGAARPTHRLRPLWTGDDQRRPSAAAGAMARQQALDAVRAACTVLHRCAALAAERRRLHRRHVARAIDARGEAPAVASHSILSNSQTSADPPESAAPAGRTAHSR